MKPTEPLRRMYEAYGKNYAHTCEKCPNFRPTTYHGAVMICLCYSHRQEEEATWHGGSIACGHYGQPYNCMTERYVVDLYDTKRLATAEGQCTMLEEQEEPNMEQMETEIKIQVKRQYLPATASSLQLLEGLAWAEESDDPEAAEACRMALRTLHGRAAVGRYTIAVDFDGTLCENNFPEIGEPRTDIIAFLRILRNDYGVRLILNTCRVEKRLREAEDWCRRHRLTFDEVNKNLPEHIAFFGSDTRKIFADEIWDDRAVCP